MPDAGGACNAGVSGAERFFAPDYTTARERFRAAARRIGAGLHALPLAAVGPIGETLTIDIAWLGPADARAALLHTSGLHGVEAFAGSAVQHALLNDPPAIAPGCALVLVHVLNPWGMAWLRRTNENNVDLNRNFLREENRWHHHGAGNLDHPARQRLLEVLCPSDPMWRRKVVARGVALARAAATWAGRRALK